MVQTYFLFLFALCFSYGQSGQVPGEYIYLHRKALFFDHITVWGIGSLGSPAHCWFFTSVALGGVLQWVLIESISVKHL